MKYRSRLDLDLYTMAAAYLCSEGKMQTEIAQSLGVSQPEVSRLLRRAEEKKWLEKHPRLICPESAKGLWQQAQAKFFGSGDLLNKLKTLEPPGASLLRKITVIYSHPDEDFSPTVTQAFEELITRVSILGVTWGRTISRLVATLRDQLPHPLRAHDPVQVVPLCGEPLKDRSDPLKYSSSALAVQMDEIINGPKDRVPPSLAGVPAFIPARFTPSEAKTLWRFIRLVAGYGAVFGEDEGHPEHRQSPLVNRVDTVFTSVGVVQSKRRGIFLRERVELGDITEQELAEWVVGDIGGIIIPKRNLKAAQANQIKSLNDRWTGIKQEHLEDCAREASTGTKPGVIVLAVGKNRADMVQRCVELGLVNELIINQELADELKGMVFPARKANN